MATEKVQIGLMVGANTFRNPGLVAKTVTTLDHISGGRAILGLGGAWFEPEHTAHGIPLGAASGSGWIGWMSRWRRVHAARRRDRHLRSRGALRLP